MPRGVRRSPEDRIKELEKKIAELKAKADGGLAKNQTVIDVAEHLKNLARDNKWQVKELMTTLTKMIVPVVRRKKAEAGEEKKPAKKGPAKK